MSLKIKQKLIVCFVKGPPGPIGPAGIPGHDGRPGVQGEAGTVGQPVSLKKIKLEKVVIKVRFFKFRGPLDLKAREVKLEYKAKQ